MGEHSEGVPPGFTELDLYKGGGTVSFGAEKKDLRELWQLDPAYVFLNHGSYGATPKSVLYEQHRLHLHIDSEPVRFFRLELEDYLDAAREKLADFVGADRDGIVFVPNATTGVNAVLRSTKFKPGDEILTTDHAYNACKNAADFVAQRDGATVKVVHIPYPMSSPKQVVDAVLSGVTDRTRFLMIDHVTSPTAVVFPVQKIIDALEGSEIDILIDGAHAPGMLPLDLTTMGMAYYTGNCHKWLCAPKGAAFLYVREDKRGQVRPVTISHGANSTRSDKSRMLLEFDWTGTGDYTPFILIPKAIEFLESLYPGGVRELMERNHRLAMEAGKMLCDRFGVPMPLPEEMIGSMVALPILRPLDGEKTKVPSGKWSDPVQDRLFHEFNIEVPVVSLPSVVQRRLIRISCHAHNSMSDYEKLADALKKMGF